MKTRTVFLTAMLAGLMVTQAHAVDNYWAADNGNWDTDAYWSAGEPTSSDIAFIDFGGRCNLVYAGEVCKTLLVGYHTSLDNRLFIYNSGQLTVTNGVTIGEGGRGTLTHNAGSCTVMNSLYLGSQNSGNGTYNLSGTGQLSAENEYVGNFGTGTFTQSGGTNTLSSDLYLGVESGSDGSYGSYDLSGTGQLSAENEYVGNYEVGTFTQSGGTNTVGAMLYLGRYAGSDGTYDLSGTGQVSADYEFIGHVGTGTFTQTGGTNDSFYLFLGDTSGSNGTYELSSTGQVSVNFERIGHKGTGTFTQTGGTHTVSFFYLGDGATGTGDYDLSNGQLSASHEYIGNNGTGTFTQTGGTNTVGSELCLGNNSGSSGTYTISYGTLDARNCTISVGRTGGGTGTFNLSGGSYPGGIVFADEFSLGSGGTFTSSGPSNLIVNTLAGFGNNPSFAGSLRIGHTGGWGSGSYSVGSGQSLTVGGSLSVGYDAVGTFTQTGGTNTATYNLVVGDEVASNGVYTLGGTGSLSVGHEIIGRLGTGRFTQTGGTSTINDAFIVGYYDTGNGTYDLSGTGSLSADRAYIGYEGTGTFTQTGGTNTLAGSLYLGDQTDGDGTYTISSGTLDARNGTISVGPMGTGEINLNGGTVIADEVSLGSGGTFNSSGTTSFLQVNKLTGFGNNPSFAGSLHIGHTGGTGSGSYSLATGQTLAVGSSLVLGLDAPATFTHSGGTNTIADYLFVGGYSGSNGTYNLSGTGGLSPNQAIIGYLGTGTLNQTGGTHTVTTDLYLGHSASGNGKYNISAGTLDVNGDLYLGSLGTGELAVTGNDATVTLVDYIQNAKGTLVSKFDADGISTISVSGTATLDGIWNVVDLGGAPAGTFNVLTATGGISGSFDAINLPGGGWSWGITGGQTLWVQHADDPDSDGDGVPDSLDLCPNTIPGAPVDADGCPDPQIPNDYDNDGDVDSDDYDAFAACASGPAVPLTPGCEDKDWDSDNDVDQSDFGVFQRCLSGANIPGDPHCIAENCTNGWDDDNDGFVDCEDDDCDGVGDCEYGTEQTCDDALDNDGDGLADCDDDDCFTDPNCAN